jgi:hypothetical protein
MHCFLHFGLVRSQSGILLPQVMELELHLPEEGELWLA